MEDFKILTERKNPLFKRREIEASIRAESTPKKEDVIKVIAENFSVPVENIKIKNILGKFGSKLFKIIVNIYDSIEDKNKIEAKSKKETKKPGETQ